MHAAPASHPQSLSLRRPTLEAADRTLGSQDVVLNVSKVASNSSARAPGPGHKPSVAAHFSGCKSGLRPRGRRAIVGFPPADPASKCQRMFSEVTERRL